VCSSCTAHKQFATAARAKDFPDLNFHDTRYSAASEMVNAGVDLYSAGAVLGHKAPASTKHYARLANGTLAKALGKIGEAATKFPHTAAVIT
jgi:site-specific recombinase XerD